MENNGITAFRPNHSSKSVKELVILGNFSLLKPHELNKMFPHVSSVKMIALATRIYQDLYEDLWASWPDLESIHVQEAGQVLALNFDAQFLGIYPEEVECLRRFDDESLGKMNIVPVRPSILTMQCLVSLINYMLHRLILSLCNI